MRDPHTADPNGAFLRLVLDATPPARQAVDDLIGLGRRDQVAALLWAAAERPGLIEEAVSTVLALTDCLYCGADRDEHQCALQAEADREDLTAVAVVDVPDPAALLS